jgi:hypothetical protein
MTEADWAALRAANEAHWARKEHARSCRLSLLGRFCRECEFLTRAVATAEARMKESSSR